MSKLSVIFQHVTFSYAGAHEALFSQVTLHFPLGWSGIVGTNGAGKTTLLRLATGLLEPGSGQIAAPAERLYCEQSTDAQPSGLASFIAADDPDACRIRGLLQIDPEFALRWDSLSHGERKRCQIGTALWQQPDLLALDEPTNHLDTEGRELLVAGLEVYRGVGLLVSHDRELLDRLCLQCAFVEPPLVTVRPGGVSAGLAQAAAEERTIAKARIDLNRERKRVKTELQRRRQVEAQSVKRASGRGADPKDSDGRLKRGLAVFTGKDKQGGKQARQFEERLRSLDQRRVELGVKKTYVQGIRLQAKMSARDHLLKLEEGRLTFGNGLALRYPCLHLAPADRVALTGPNGGGKSTLIRSIVSKVNVGREQLVYIPQEIDLEESRRILLQTRQLPREKLGWMMSIVSRLGSRPERLLASNSPSPGELRKLMLALGLVHEPELVIMDEPTNHMDLSSVQCLEEALEECECAMVLVSHDRLFLDKLTNVEWRIVRDGKQEFALQLPGLLAVP